MEVISRTNYGLIVMRWIVSTELSTQVVIGTVQNPHIIFGIGLIITDGNVRLEAE